MRLWLWLKHRKRLQRIRIYESVHPEVLRYWKETRWYQERVRAMFATTPPDEQEALWHRLRYGLFGEDYSFPINSKNLRDFKRAERHRMEVDLHIVGLLGKTSKFNIF